MMPTVDVIVDRDNDVATVKALHALAAREPGVLAVSIAPGSDAEPAVVWAILRALGKRIEQLPQTSFKVFWMDAERWLTAASRAVTHTTLATGAALAPAAAALRLLAAAIGR